jgi:hypothetical protein
VNERADDPAVAAKQPNSRAKRTAQLQANTAHLLASAVQFGLTLDLPDAVFEEVADAATRVLRRRQR